MPNFNNNAWRFCKGFVEISSKEETLVVYIYEKIIDCPIGEGKYWTLSEIKSPASNKLNPKSISALLKIELVCRLSLNIPRSDIRKFFRYMEERELIEISRPEVRDKKHYHGEKLRDDEFSIASTFEVDGNHEEVAAYVKLTTKGIDIANKSWIEYHQVEATWFISVGALIVSIIALAAG